MKTKPPFVPVNEKCFKPEGPFWIAGHDESETAYSALRGDKEEGRWSKKRKGKIQTQWENDEATQTCYDKGGCA